MCFLNTTTKTTPCFSIELSVKQIIINIAHTPFPTIKKTIRETRVPPPPLLLSTSPTPLPPLLFLSSFVSSHLLGLHHEFLYKSGVCVCVCACVCVCVCVWLGACVAGCVGCVIALHCLLHTGCDLKLTFLNNNPATQNL